MDLLRERVKRLMPRAKEDLARMVSFRSVYDPRETPPEDCDRMVDFTLDVFSAAGARDVEAHETSDGSKVVCGHIPNGRMIPRASRYT